MAPDEGFDDQSNWSTRDRWSWTRLINDPMIRRDVLTRGAVAAAALALTRPRTAGARRAPLDCGPYREKCRRGQHCCPRGTVCNDPSATDALCIGICLEDGRPDSCGRDCVNLDTDERNCGGCGRKCAAGKTCAGGRCITGDGTTCAGGCAPGQICCSGSCTYPSESEKNCGACGKTCAGRKAKCCFGRCVGDLSADPNNCGKCLERCHSDQVCYQGECRTGCPEGLRKCGRTCGQVATQACCNGELIDRDVLDFDEKNCGKCGNVCSTSLAPNCCSGKCVQLGLDDCNCGECGKVCPPGEFCRFGTCTCAVSPCTGPPRVCD